MKDLKKELEAYCEEHWYNFGKKTLSFKGELRDLLKSHNITFTKRKTDREGVFTFTFKSAYDITFKSIGTAHDFRHLAKQFIQMELVRMGDKSQLYVSGAWRPTVTVNY
jgi:hypothetical protein